MIEEMEANNEELQSTNEDLVAFNEELQSTNEELHSLNKELDTVNAEYQKKLLELTTEMDNLLASTEVHTIFLDHDLTIRKFTPKIAETFKLMPQDLGKRIDHFTPNIDHTNLEEDIRTVLQTGSRFEKQVQDRRGRWFLLRILPYHSEKTIQGVVLTLIDIDKLKLAEADALEHRQQLATILQHSPHLVFIKDLQGRILQASESFHKLAGSQVTGKTLYDIFPRNSASMFVALDERAMKEGNLAEGEVMLPLPDGEHTFLCAVYPLHDEQGRISGVAGVNTDLTGLKRAEQQARETVQQRDRFLAILSHELRNPLGAILNALYVTRSAEPRSAAAIEAFQIIERRGWHMARLLEDLLDISRLTQNKIALRKQVFDIAATVEEALEEVRPHLLPQRIHLTVTKSGHPLMVEGDPNRLQQIQVNLLMNAVKYTPTEGHIDFRMQCEDDKVVIRVRDNGIGIHPNMIEKVFDLFVQSSNTSDRYQSGIGVGLTLVRAIVELHGGQVKAYSDGPGKGTEFVVWLPMYSETDSQRSRKKESTLSGKKLDSSKPAKRRILIVEDDMDIRDTLQSLLKMEGHQVTSTSDGMTALNLLNQHCPDVALLDIGLPEIDGYELARRIRMKQWPIYLVALTGYGQPADRDAALKAGFDAHLTKPVNPTDLYQLLATMKTTTTESTST